ncbi:MAG: hypothetical protein IPP41_02135 [Rhodocyclaceae bacterium]|nr:hypothetical protein [Rhodocyclaceae bacterium]
MHYRVGFPSLPVIALVVSTSVFQFGCASMQSHDRLATEVQATSRVGGFPAAIAQLDATATTVEDRAALLYNLERGELLRLNKQYAESTESFLKADAKVQTWEDAAKSNPTKLMGLVGASLVSERLAVYEGQDYEKVWLTTRLALNRLAQGDLDNARVDLKRTHEREAVIAEFRSSETLAAEEEAKKKGATTGTKELNGYPVESLNDPEVTKLKNGYQNALSHYLAGFVYEVLGETGLAAPGYRKAIELRPGMAVLEEGLRGLDGRTSFGQKRAQKMTDVLFVIEAGNAPARKPRGFTVPIPGRNGIKTVSISYPVIDNSNDAPLGAISIGGKSFKLDNVVDVNVMARRALKDAMPGMVVRSVIRAIAKSEMQEQLSKNGGMFGAIVGIVAAAATEGADDRMWRMLPGRVYLARGHVPAGLHRLDVDGRSAPVDVNIDGQYALVAGRIYDGVIIPSEVASFGRLAAAPATVASDKPVAKKPSSPPAVKKPSKPVPEPVATTPKSSTPTKH